MAEIQEQVQYQSKKLLNKNLNNLIYKKTRNLEQTKIALTLEVEIMK